MLAIYAYDTNTGIRAVASGDRVGGHGHSRKRSGTCGATYLTPETARRIAVDIANAAFAARDAGVGPGCAHPRSTSPPT